MVLERAAQRGTKVHKATESLDRYGDVEIEDEYAPYIEAYIKFRRDHKCEWEKIEYSTYHTDLRYAMTADRVGVMDGKKVLLDIKTTSALQTIKVTAQLTLYKMALESQGFQIEECYALRLDKDGKYHLKKIEPDYKLADSCLYLHNILKKKKRGKKYVETSSGIPDV